MALWVERQREVNLGLMDTGDSDAGMQVRNYESKGAGPRNYIKKKGPLDKKNLVCGHCNKPRHSKDICFKIHGMHDWYRDLNDERKRSGSSGKTYAANEAEQQLLENVNIVNHDIVAELMEALKIVQNKIPYDSAKVHFAQNTEMDLKSNHTLAIGKQKGRLYYLDTDSFVPISLSQKIQKHVSCLSSDAQLYTLWHLHLRHDSSNVLSHISVLNFKESNFPPAHHIQILLLIFFTLIFWGLINSPR
ncbi:UNVERIFIED_CONTAM: hypothetical protein Sradi_0197400 [Sesamum radiatum]|uniref:GAG-pre-integrase domain-containing protein n=1 Tax=Sesamum radiatum TaxID=300843 RepID=A0AAW2W427_SESRA